ncbi:MAG TPA: LapA family protein [Actinomycetota bacterium]|nr:LapA family protein [Actinomycetota bacterium]
MSSGWEDLSKSRRGSSHSGRGGDPGIPPIGGAPTPSERSSIAKGRGGKAVAAAILVILAIIFVIGNLNRVRVNFIITSGHPRMIWLIVGCLLIGGITGFMLGRPARARRRHEE